MMYTLKCRFLYNIHLDMWKTYNNFFASNLNILNSLGNQIKLIQFIYNSFENNHWNNYYNTTQKLYLPYTFFFY